MDCCTWRGPATHAATSTATRVDHAEPQYQLIGLSWEIKGLCVRVGDDEIVLGKTPESGLSLDHDRYASRRHARVFRSDGKVFLEDLGSSNGTFLRIREAVALEPGDEIAIGTSVIRLVSIDSAGKIKEPS
jgi:hypothetical protein